MCKCTPNKRTMFCGAPGCEWPEQTVDLSKARKGDKVKFRCGGEATIKTIGRNYNYSVGEPVFDLSFEGFDEPNALVVRQSGIIGKTGNTTPFDIIAIEPAPFEWKDVRPGHAFFTNQEKSEVIRYVGKSSISPLHAFETTCDTPRILWVSQDQLQYGIRCEEHDVEAQE